MVFALVVVLELRWLRSRACCYVHFVGAHAFMLALCVVSVLHSCCIRHVSVALLYYAYE